MKRFLILILPLALILAGFGAALNHANAHAFGGNCGNPFDSVDTIYDDGYFPYGGTTVGPDGSTYHVAKTDIKAWRYTDSGNGDCMRGYYTSAWVTDQTWANVNDVLRVWACGQFAGSRAAYSNGNSWRAAQTQIDWTGAMGYAVVRWVSDVWPSGDNVFFVNYGNSGSPCGQQVDNFYSSVAKPNWNYNFGPVVNPPGTGYLNETCFIAGASC